MATRRRSQPTPKLPKGYISVPAAARSIRYTSQGIYAAIKRGDISSLRKGRRVWVRGAEVREYRRKIEQWFRDQARIRAGRLTDEEFIQRMWDNDPD